MSAKEPFQLPRAIDVLRFAAAREPEITAIYNSLKLSGKLSLGTGLRRHLRRRPRSHNTYRHTLRPNSKLAPLREAQKNSIDASQSRAASSEPYTNRKMRRRKGKLQSKYALSAQWTEDTVVMEEAEEGPPRRLETHLWQVKRLTMTDYWGWTLPEGALGRGRGSRNFIKHLRTGAFMHDASYWCPLQISGLPGELQQVLSAVLDPADIPEMASLLSKDTSRSLERQFMLHEPVERVQAPRGAICPVIVSCFTGQRAIGDRPPNSNEERSMLFWIHTAAVKQAHDALSTAITATECMGVSLKVKDLRRIEIRGHGAEALVAKALFTHTEPPKDNRRPEVTTYKLSESLNGIEAAEIRHVVIPDPRIAHPFVLGNVAASLLEEIPTPTDLHLFQEGSSVAPPAPESRISVWRKYLREDFMGLTNNRIFVGAPPVLQRDPADNKYGTHCPLVYVHEPWGSPMPGCSLIIPPGWTLPLWHALAYVGCRAMGQREWHWLHTLLRLPFFPHDMPDTNTYSETMQVLRQKQQHNAATRPKGRFSGVLELPPPWWLVSTLQTSVQQDSLQGDKASITLESPIVVVRNGIEHWLKMTSEGCSIPPIIPQEGAVYIVEVAVHAVKRGRISPGAALCVIPGREGLFDKLPWYQTKAGLTREPPNDGSEPAESAVLAEKPLVIGHVTSPAPYGASRTVESVGLCSLPALRKLMSLVEKQQQQQRGQKKRKGGAVVAYFKNPESTAVFPAYVRLLHA